jgi:hypothetical protein
MCFRVYGTLVWLFAFIACYAGERVGRLRSVGLHACDAVLELVTRIDVGVPQGRDRFDVEASNGTAEKNPCQYNMLVSKIKPCKCQNLIALGLLSVDLGICGLLIKRVIYSATGNCDARNFHG